jgi:hypothetical protein
MLRAFYRVIAVGAVTLLGLLMALNVIFVACRINPFYTMLETWSNLALLPFFLIGAFFGIGMAVLWFGMMWDCAFTSKMRVWSKALWLLLLIPTSSIGALIYYFCVYRDHSRAESGSRRTTANPSTHFGAKRAKIRSG